MEKYKAKPLAVEAIKFPDSGPEQHSTSVWVEDNGGKLNLYDGEVEDGIKTSTNAVWHWMCGSLKTANGSCSVNIGDFIIKGHDGKFSCCTPEIFAQSHALIKPE